MEGRNFSVRHLDVYQGQEQSQHVSRQNGARTISAKNFPDFELPGQPSPVTDCRRRRAAMFLLCRYINPRRVERGPVGPRGGSGDWGGLAAISRPRVTADCRSSVVYAVSALPLRKLTDSAPAPAGGRDRAPSTRQRRFETVWCSWSCSFAWVNFCHVFRFNLRDLSRKTTPETSSDLQHGVAVRQEPHDDLAAPDGRSGAAMRVAHAASGMWIVRDRNAVGESRTMLRQMDARNGTRNEYPPRMRTRDKDCGEAKRGFAALAPARVQSALCAAWGSSPKNRLPPALIVLALLRRAVDPPRGPAPSAGAAALSRRSLSKSRWSFPPRPRAGFWLSRRHGSAAA